MMNLMNRSFFRFHGFEVRSVYSVSRLSEIQINNAQHKRLFNPDRG
jgi:hypothetical protein